jgi:chemotaxis methyl-accepting protein methylase
LQSAVLARVATRLRSGSYLVIGAHERLPDGQKGFIGLDAKLPIYRKERP